MCQTLVTFVTLTFLAAVDPLTPRGEFRSGLDNPSRLAIHAGQLYVADTRAHRVCRFDAATPGAPPEACWEEPAGPVGIAVDASGRLFIARRDDARIAIYDPSFHFIEFFAPATTLAGPTDLVFDDSSGRLYVTDSPADRVYAFNPDGSLSLMFGIRGSGFGQFKHPTSIAVDAARDRVIVADQDNYRVQVFTRAGLFLFSFGYRVRYVPGGLTEGWFPRVSGVAVDGSGRIYVADALMSTLRAYSPTGAELGQLAGYGATVGGLQTPADVAIGADQAVFVASSNGGAVSAYAPLVALVVASAEEVELRGTNAGPVSALQILRTLNSKPYSRLSSRSEINDPVVAASSWSAPHTLADTTCGRCHDVDGQPGGHLATIEGQAQLCISCHTGAGHALESALRSSDCVSFGGSAPDGGGRSHAWGVPAINEAAGSAGPPAGSEIARYTSAGNIKCATCHNQHNSQSGAPYLRMANSDGQLCRQCHTEHITHTPHGAWQPTCSECHDMHNPRSANIGLVATGIYNQTLGVQKEVTLTSRTGEGSFSDGDPAANDGLCQVCHTATAYHRHDGTGGPHNAGQDCLSCHPHGNGFLPAGGDCMSCHATAQDNGDGLPAGGRRGVTGEFPLADSHAHYGAELDSSDCGVCHDQSTHMDGYVDLLDPDGGAAFRFVRASDLTGDPDLSNFCMACHDETGAARLANPLDPFGSGGNPPSVAAKFSGTLQWQEQYGDFCLGNEGMLRGVNSHHDISDEDQAFSGAKIECLNCHGAHSSGGSQPMADPFDPAHAWTGAADDFCLECHGGGFGPLDPGFPPGVMWPVVDVDDPRWASMGFDWATILGGACLTTDCSSIRGIDSCDYVEGPWYVDYAWTHSAHGAGSKRAWNGYSGAPSADMNCTACHDPHGSATASNTAGNPYMIRDTVDGTAFVDDGTRTAGFSGPPWNQFGVSMEVEVTAAGQEVAWGGTKGLCAACHADWVEAYDFHSFCNACQICHGHGMAWNEADWEDFDDDVPCPVNGLEGGEAPAAVEVKEDSSVPPLHRSLE